ncbi:MAG: hypothetical protein GYA51_07235 [Candidatus Methanofastidiosa archaeon]|nr:hypothetical protein [Candidatus Methanofastidiosa archaeon]
MKRKVGALFFFLLLILNGFAVLGFEEIKPIEYNLNELIMAGEMSRNGDYIALGTMISLYVFDKTGTIVWENKSTGRVYDMIFTYDDKYLLALTAGDEYAFETTTGNLSKYELTDYGIKIGGKDYTNTFYDTPTIEVFYKDDSDWWIQTITPAALKDPKGGFIYYSYGRGRDVCELHHLAEVKGKDEQPPQVVAMNTYDLFYRYQGKIYTSELFKELDIPKEDIQRSPIKGHYFTQDSGIVGNYFVISTTKGVYLYDKEGTRKWFVPIKVNGWLDVYNTMFSPYIILINSAYDSDKYIIHILDQDGNILMEYLFNENSRFRDARRDIVAIVTKSGTLYIFDLKEVKNTESSTETNTESQNANLSNEANNTIASNAKEETNETKETPNTTETKNTPGFELPAVLGGSILAVYIMNKRRK